MLEKKILFQGAFAPFWVRLCSEQPVQLYAMTLNANVFFWRGGVDTLFEDTSYICAGFHWAWSVRASLLNCLLFLVLRL